VEITPLDLSSLSLERAELGTKREDLVSSFQEMLGKALDKVNDLQNNADEMMKRLAAGEVKDIHRVMIAVEEASLSLQLTMQIRSKIIDAYQEIMRMPV